MPSLLHRLHQAVRSGDVRDWRVRASRRNWLRQTLVVRQRGSRLQLDLRMREDVSVVGLWARQDQDWMPLAADATRAGLRATVDLLELAQDIGRLRDEPSRAVDEAAAAPTVAASPEEGVGEAESTDESTATSKSEGLSTDDDGEPGFVVSLYLEIERVMPADATAVERLARGEHSSVTPLDDERVLARQRIQLGRFAETDMDVLFPAVGGGHTVAPYPSRRGFLVVAVDRPLKPYARVNVNWLSTAGGHLRMTGRLLTRHGEVQSARLLVRGRTTGFEASLPMHLQWRERETRAKFGLRRYDFSVRGDWGDLLGHPGLADDTFDAWAVISTRQSPAPATVRVGHTRFLTQYLTRPGWSRRGRTAAAITPYYTFKAKKTSFQVDLFDAEVHEYLRRSVRRRHLLRLVNHGRKVWLVGERPYKAQDTGYHFFRYLRENHPEIDAYYVIDPTSSEYSNVERLGNVLPMRSKEHVKATLLADRIIGSHHPDFLYPLRTKAFRRSVRAPKVFLQHGVMGTKWMVPNYGKEIHSFETDLFIVSSEREKEYIVRDFGYAPDEVAVTGLSRFDSLLAGDVPVEPHQLLVIPTWRDWLQGDQFADSEYYQRWSEVLHHPRLRALADRRGLEVLFCLHPNMQQYRHWFDDTPARVISQGEVDVQHLLKQSAMLVTDYSSVGFDFSFLHKPVAYYQFDQDRFLGRLGSHLDLFAELPGPIVTDVDALIDEITRRYDDGFTMQQEYARRADRFLTHRDRGSSERIFEQVLTATRADSRWQRIRSHELSLAAYRVFRRSRWYFPVMRKTYPLLTRLLPLDPNLVVFESGMGRQYADSPRYIYEELVRRDSPHTKVWAYSGHLPFHDERTKVVERLSPAYYWQLARAGHWVNNQSFPHYITRRDGTTFVQTWHGTPLKRMLFDLEEIHGRDEGYVQRVSRAVAQWSVLVSPSAFMTNAMRSAYHFTGKALEVGYPRNDVFFRPDRDAMGAGVRQRLGIPQDARVVLYAPTFRDNRSAGGTRFHFDLPFDLERFCKELGEDTVLLLRMHVLIRGRLAVPEAVASQVVDVSRYPEIQELYLASDVLVTDYSSVFFDFANLRRPIVFYAHDLEEYQEELRGFYLDYGTDLPGPVARTEDDLYATLGDLDRVERDYAERYEAFLQRFSPHEDGHAAERVVDHVFTQEG